MLLLIACIHIRKQCNIDPIKFLHMTWKSSNIRLQPNELYSVCSNTLWQLRKTTRTVINFLDSSRLSLQDHSFFTFIYISFYPNRNIIGNFLIISVKIHLGTLITTYPYIIKPPSVGSLRSVTPRGNVQGVFSFFVCSGCFLLVACSMFTISWKFARSAPNYPIKLRL